MALIDVQLFGGPWDGAIKAIQEPGSSPTCHFFWDNTRQTHLSYSTERKSLLRMVYRGRGDNSIIKRIGPQGENPNPNPNPQENQ